jgi:hypothetical protein
VSRVEPGAVVVWRIAGALLAAELHAVAEVAPVSDGGVVQTRDGDLELTPIPGLGEPSAPLAVVLQPQGAKAGMRVALPADAVEGVLTPGTVVEAEPPGWLRALHMPHVQGLLRVDGDRLVALLHADAIGDG